MPDTFPEEAAPISDYAIIVNPDDNVAVVKNEMADGIVLSLPSDENVTVSKAVPPGHRFAICEIPKGQFVRQYGQPIGTSLGVAKGEWITHDNMTDEVPIVRDLPEDLHILAPDYFSPDQI